MSANKTANRDKNGHRLGGGRAIAELLEALLESVAAAGAEAMLGQLTSSDLVEVADSDVSRGDELPMVGTTRTSEGSSLDWINNKAALRLLGVSRPTLQRWRADGKLPYSKVDGLIYYKRSDINDLFTASMVDRGCSHPGSSESGGQSQ